VIDGQQMHEESLIARHRPISLPQRAQPPMAFVHGLDRMA